jgi:hypothetical protein
MRKRAACVVCLGLALLVVGVAQQDKSKRPSPPGHAEVDLGGKKITVDYSRPSVRNPKTGHVRKIFGEGAGYLEPYGCNPGCDGKGNQAWRLGANEATTFKTEADLDINGTTVPAGEYTLFAIPNADNWTLVISKKTGEWGIPYPGEQYDLARVPMQVSKLSSPVERFTISLDKQGDDTAVMNAEWAETRASVTLKKK